MLLSKWGLVARDFKTTGLRAGITSGQLLSAAWVCETFKQNLLHHQPDLAWPGGARTCWQAACTKGLQPFTRSGENTEILLGVGGAASPPKIYLFGNPPPKSISALARPVPIGGCLFPTFDVSFHVLLHTPAKLIFLKHHFAHVTNLLKTNLWGLFCT